MILRRLTRAAPIRIDVPGGLVSFTFDDFPKSAALNGASILEKYQARRTFYGCLGMMGGRSNPPAVTPRKAGSRGG